MTGHTQHNQNAPDPACYLDAYHLVLECSKCPEKKNYVSTVLEQLEEICYFDEALVFFLNPNGKLIDVHKVNVEQRWLDEYLNYYLKSEDFPREFDIQRALLERSPGSEHVRMIQWDRMPQSEFVREYIRQRNLKYSWAFCFSDTNGVYRVVFSLNRTRDVPFSELEQDRLRLALPILNNIYRRYFCREESAENVQNQADWARYRLTKRETEIAKLLCQGMTVQNISKTLYIAKTTTYKHISNIYGKVGVSSQQELLVEMINAK